MSEPATGNQRPATGRRRPLKAVKNTLIYWAVLGCLAAIRLFPLPFVRCVFRSLGGLAARLPTKENAIVRTNLAACFPEKDAAARETILRACWLSIGACAGEAIKVAVSGLRAASLCAWAPGAKEALDTALAGGAGMVYITGHVGNWELMAQFVAESGYPTYTAAKESYDPRLTDLIRRYREARGVHCLWRGDAQIKEKLIGVLIGNGVLGFLIDQDTKVPSVFADFFGRKAYTPSAPAKIVAKAKVPAVAGFIHRTASDRHVVSVRRLDTAVPEGADPVIHLTTAFNAAIEAEVRAHPEEWVWMHARWKTRPPCR